MRLFPKLIHHREPGQDFVINARTVQNFIKYGKYIEVNEALEYDQFTEKPINLLNDRSYAPNFSEMVSTRKEDGDILFAIDLHTAVIAGRGYHFTCPHPGILEKVEAFAKDFKLQQFLNIAVDESLSYGNSFFQYVEPGNKIDIRWLPIDALSSLIWKDGKVSQYQFNTYGQIPAEEILHLTWRRIAASPYGYGLIEPLITSRDYSVMRSGETINRTRPAIMAIKAEMQDIGRKIMQRYVPRSWINITGAGNKDGLAARFKNKLKTLEPNEDVISPVDATVQELNRNMRSVDWESWEKLFRNEIITTMENPAIRIFTEPGFTKANADAAIESVKMLLRGFSEYLSAQVLNAMIRPWYESDPWITADGQKIPWKYAKIGFNWGPQEIPNLTIDNLIALGQLASSGFPVISASEMRKNLRRFNVELPDNDEAVSAAAAKPMQITDQATGKTWTASQQQ